MTTQVQTPAQRFEALTQRHTAMVARRERARGSQESNAEQLRRHQEYCLSEYGTSDPAEILAMAEKAEAEDNAALDRHATAIDLAEAGLTEFETKARELAGQNEAGR